MQLSQSFHIDIYLYQKNKRIKEEKFKYLTNLDIVDALQYEFAK